MNTREIMAWVLTFGRQENWHLCYTIRNTRLMDGSIAFGPLMRQFVSGQPQYRLETAEEAAERHESTIW